MRWWVDLNLRPATERLEAAFGLVTTFRLLTVPVVGLFGAELDEAKGELTPMSPGNHIQSLA